MTSIISSFGNVAPYFLPLLFVIGLLAASFRNHRLGAVGASAVSVHNRRALSRRLWENIKQFGLIVLAINLLAVIGLPSVWSNLVWQLALVVMTGVVGYRCYSIIWSLIPDSATNWWYARHFLVRGMIKLAVLFAVFAAGIFVLVFIGLLQSGLAVFNFIG